MLALAVFVAEALVMVVIDSLLPPMASILTTLLDASALVTLLFPVFYFLMFRPLTRTMQQDGVIAAFGNAGGAELHTTVYPFILRGLHLVGVDSAATPMNLRRDIWQRLAGNLHPARLDLVAHTIALSELPGAFDAMLCGAAQGRTVVRVGNG